MKTAIRAFSDTLLGSSSLQSTCIKFPQAIAKRWEEKLGGLPVSEKAPLLSSIEGKALAEVTIDDSRLLKSHVFVEPKFDDDLERQIGTIPPPPEMNGFKSVAAISVCIPLESYYQQRLSGLPFTLLFSASDAPVPPGVIDSDQGIVAIQLDANQSAAIRSRVEVRHGEALTIGTSEGEVAGHLWLFGQQTPVRLPDGELLGAQLIATAWFQPIGRSEKVGENFSPPSADTGVPTEQPVTGAVFLGLARRAFGHWKINGMTVNSSVGFLFVPLPGNAEFELREGPNLVFVFERLDSKVDPWYEKTDEAMILHCPMHGVGATIEFTLQLTFDDGRELDVRTVAQWIFERVEDRIERARLSVNFLNRTPDSNGHLAGLEDLAIAQISRYSDGVNEFNSLEPMALINQINILTRKVNELETNLAWVLNDHAELNRFVVAISDRLSEQASEAEELLRRLSPS